MKTAETRPDPSAGAAVADDKRLRIGVVGPTGRMGQKVCALVEAAPDLVLACCVGVEGEPTGQTIGAVDAAMGRGDLAPIDVLIDFSHRSAIAAHGAFCARHGVAWILGTTGLEATDEVAVAAASGQTLVFQAANFSIGVALLLDLAARAARVLGVEADVEIVESHHHHKVDAPSGTALAIAKAVAGARSQALNEVVRHGRHGLVGARPRGEIGMHALRLGDVVGHHELHFAWPAEGLVLTHDARDRAVFAEGAVRAARFAAHRRRGGAVGRIGMAELLAGD